MMNERVYQFSFFKCCVILVLYQMYEANFGFFDHQLLDLLLLQTINPIYHQSYNYFIKFYFLSMCAKAKFSAMIC